MKVKINVEKEGQIAEVEFDLHFKGRDQKSYLKKISEIAKSLDKENPESALAESNEFIDFENKMLAEKTNLSLDELEDLDLEEKKKLTKVMRELLMPFSGQESFF
jgi:polysaccharide pyruvyl transferase WcaK-like protein